jgi:hypothetical protein
MSQLTKDHTDGLDIKVIRKVILLMIVTFMRLDFNQLAMRFKN